MIMFSCNGVAPVSGAVRPAQVRPAAAASAHGTERHYDQITISAKDGESPFLMQVKSRLNQEVRTATTTGTLAAIREEIEAGTYQIDAGAIARKMLLLGEV